MFNRMELEDLVNSHGGIISTSDAEKAGLSRTAISILARNGLLIRLARGQYALPGDLTDELFLWQKRMKSLVYSHETALFLHGIAERTPSIHSITLPDKMRLSASFPCRLKVYTIQSEQFEIGLVQMPTKMGHEVRSYDLERTICDVIRSRNRIDDQTFFAALKNYAERSDKNLNRLGNYAMQFKVANPLRRYLEILL